ncbi:MAG: isocitrate lyase/PEP mutase family protein [Paracoccaceae bacterium]|jgi:2-methylisocitrate lyase-like PEP mutase family enzyme|nr:MAG: carboxyvinyl-carboxyphosphonate phosphorylmutase [Paracoccaceae bacterium]RPF94371.1 MAG: isocitrate lyase/PEP mutase family protein [Rhodobacteraceae bacterium TMED160]|tara:strand:- start:177 stop:1025 length:849 start_codon:yes stop_codon:yes gene_type:complete
MLKSIIKTETLLAPGIYDALSGLIAEQSGAKAAYLSGASIAYTRFGRSDIGLVSVSEVHDTLAAVTDRIKIPIIVDADTGFGNALNVQRTIRSFERAGAAAIQIEDQSFPKRCGHLDGKVLIKKDEMVGKVKAAVDSRKTSDTLIIARTDARAVEGLQEAIDRAHAYHEAGADVLFIEAPRSVDELKLIRKSFDLNIPLLANMVEGGKTPVKTANDLKSLGFNIVIFPGGAVRAATFQLQEYYAGLLKNGSNSEFSKKMHNFDSLNSVIGTPELLKIGKKYE